MTFTRMVRMACAAFLGAMASGPAAPPVTDVLHDFESDASPVPGECRLVSPGSPTGAKRALRWHVSPQAAPQFLSLDMAGYQGEADEWDELVFDYRFDALPDWLGVKLLDYPLVAGFQATWQLAATIEDAGRWRQARLPLHAPQWRWGDKPNRDERFLIFRIVATDPGTLNLDIDNVRFCKPRLSVRVAPDPSDRRPGPWRQDARIALLNRTDAAVRVRLQAIVEDERVTFPGQGLRVDVPADSEVTCTFPVRLSPTTPPLTVVPYRVMCYLGEETEMENEVRSEIAAPLTSTQHPCLLLTRDQVPRVRQRIRDREGGQQWWEGHLMRADSWLRRTPQFPARGSQWWHWYSCKECGTGLKTESPTRHVCPDCGAVYSGWPYDDVILDRLHNALAAATRDLGLAYLVTDDRRYAAKAREILLGYADRYLKYPLHNVHGRPEKGGAHVGPQTLDEAVWLIKIAQGFDAILDTLSPQDYERIATELLYPAALLIKDHQWGIHNICCWQATAYGLVGLALDDADLTAAAIAGPKGFRAQVAEGVTEDGQWYERSWGYHFYTMSALEPLAVACTNIGIDVLSEQYRSMYDAPLKFLTPTDHLPALNDSGRTQFRGPGFAARYEPAYGWWTDPLHGFVVRQGQRDSMAAVLWGADKAAEAGVTFASAVYADVGVVVLRSDSSEAAAAMPANYLGLDFGEHGGGHGHPDKLNIVLWGHGQLLSEDPGCIAYGNPAHAGWYRQTLSHNTMVVDGKSQAPTTGELLFHALAENGGLCCAISDGAYPGVGLGRMTAILGDVILDLCWAESDAEHVYDWTYHCRGDLTLSMELATADAPDGDGYSWVKDWRSAGIDGPWRASWLSPERVRLFLNHDPGQDGTLWSGLGMANPPKILFPVVMSRVEGRAAQFRSVFVISDGDETPQAVVSELDVEVREGGPVYALEATFGSTTYQLVAMPGGGAASVRGYRIRGQGAVFATGPGGKVQVLAPDGTTVTRQD